MAIELHHFFIITQPYAPEAELVAALGLVEGSRNKHPGQGTSNRRFFFGNTTLELIYVHDSQEALEGAGQRLYLYDRSVKPTASPFGLVMQTIPGDTDIPFAGWQYCPDYFPADTCFHTGENASRIEEPLCICMPDRIAHSARTAEVGNPSWMLTELSVSTLVSDPSRALIAACQGAGITLVSGQPDCLELTFNHGVMNKYADFRVASSSAQGVSLPLIMRW